jgi:hypothetical protein
MSIATGHALVLALTAACALPAAAATITLNYPAANIASSSGTVMDARYRVSNTNWDQMIASDSNISPSVIVQQANLGTHNQLNGALWNFSIGYAPTSGWTYTLALDSGGNPSATTSTLVWNTPFNGASPTRSFNALELFAVVGSLPGGVSSMSMQVTGMTFVSPGNTVIGTLPDLTTTGGLVRQWVYSDSDLSATSWTLAGQLRGAFVGTTGSNLDERIKFDVKATTVTLVPSPGAATLLGLSGLLAARRRRA